ncbi:hypothetical protein [Streptomyces abikoensis]|uniref:hypothetical protein n=1 Tax=Streptomyces abikoensis TaxID=97398 RepID=UPI003690F4C1
MAVATGGMTGMELAEHLLRDMGNEWMRAATRLRGAHRNDFRLRRFLEEGRDQRRKTEISAAADPPVIDRDGARLGELGTPLRRQEGRTGSRRFPGQES